MVKAVGELALAGVGIIPAIEPSRGYTDMVPFNPLLYWENEKRVCCLFAWHSVLPGRDLLWLKPFGISFYKLLVLKTNDRNRVWSQFCCSENSEMYGKNQPATLEFKVKISTLCRGTLKTDSLRDSTGRHLWEISQMEIHGANGPSPLWELAWC